MKPRDVDLDRERENLEGKLGRPISNEDLALYLLYPFDGTSYLKFEAQYGKQDAFSEARGARSEGWAVRSKQPNMSLQQILDRICSEPSP